MLLALILRAGPHPRDVTRTAAHSYPGRASQKGALTKPNASSALRDTQRQSRQWMRVTDNGLLHLKTPRALHKHWNGPGIHTAWHATLAG